MAVITGGPPSDPGTALTYRNCPRCQLSIAERFRGQAIEHCPRCIARYHQLVDLFSSPQAAGQRADRAI